MDFGFTQRPRPAEAGPASDAMTQGLGKNHAMPTGYTSHTMT
jgi:hypothetical protein